MMRGVADFRYLGKGELTTPYTKDKGYRRIRFTLGYSIEANNSTIVRLLVYFVNLFLY
jgi:hypothetical protein